MPSFQHLLVLSVLALSLSVQSAPVETVESRDLGHVSRSAEPDVAPFEELEAREFDDDEDDTLEARAKKPHHAHRKPTKPKGKGHKGHKGASLAVDGTYEGIGFDGHADLSLREFDDDEDNTLEAREKKKHQVHRKEAKKGKGSKGKRSLADIDE
ncbi:hypothetical protein LXA43DRAFT_100011 [Ganoderma leucocontextum]|nr:hypothetical protein LXA43DRAFT_100011 [Ganoderma leucocontextum]